MGLGSLYPALFRRLGAEPAFGDDFFLGIEGDGVGTVGVQVCVVSSHHLPPVQSASTLQPPIGSQVWVEFEQGDSDYPIWTGGFWGTVALPPGRTDGYYNRLVEDEVAKLDGLKSLYSTAFYPEDEFYQRYDGAAYQAVKRAYDADGRLLSLYDKCVLGR